MLPWSRSLRIQSKPMRQVAKDLGFPRWTYRIHWMRSRRWNAARQVKEDGCRVFVCGHRRTERDITEVLQCVGSSVIRGIARSPKPIALGELFGRERGETKQIVRSVF